MNNKKSFPRKLLYNKRFTITISVIAAIIFWFIVVTYVSPDYKHTIGGVKVNIDENTSNLTAVGLHAVDKSSETVNIEVSGPRNIIGRLSASDFSVTPNYGVITKAGSYEVELAATLKAPDNRVRITKIDPAYISVRFDTLATKTLPVQVKMQDSGVPSGYIMQSAVANPAQITISGPSANLDKIANAVAYVKINGDASKTTVIKSPIVLLGQDGKELDYKSVQLSSPNVDVTVPILKTKDAKLKVNFTNIPAGVDTSNISYKISPATIAIAGDAAKIDATSEISLGSIDFSKLDINTTQTLKVPDLDGIMNVDNVTSATVTVQLKNTASRVMSTGTFSVLNQPSGYDVVVKTKQIPGIKLFGPSTDIGNVDSLTAIINMAGFQSGSGQYEMPVTFQVDGKTGYWVTGTYDAFVRVKKSD